MLAGEKVGRNTKFGILAGCNLVDLRLYISHTHSFKLLRRVKMEQEVDVAKFAFKNIVREYHAYQTIWEAAIGK